MVFHDIGLQVPTILLPREGTDMRHWAVIACDQYTSDRAYWQRLRQQVGEQPSTLKLIFPEVYLEDNNSEERIAAINRQMDDYLDGGCLSEAVNGFVLVDRQTAAVPSRKGLMVALDLESYDYRPGATSLIRATEGTILDRLPPRIKVRQDAAIELPHIMVLIDDPQKTVIEPLFDEPLDTLYDFDLLENGGHLTGYRVDQPRLIEQVASALRQLADPQAYRERYQRPDEPVMLYAMGDGNHSFATAKAIWEQLKDAAEDPAAIMDHPARYALVELVNLHDPGLEFEAIHRVLFNVNCVHIKQQMTAFCAEQGMTVSFTPCTDLREARSLAGQAEGAHAFVMTSGGKFGVCKVEAPHYTLPVATLQAFLDHYLSAFESARLDYIHGDQAVIDLTAKHGCTGFFLPAIDKDDFFRTIIVDGALPRKTFSMGEADEKRFYLECRRIRD